MNKHIVLSEDFEQTRFAGWLEANKYLFTASPAGLNQRSAITRAKGYRTGVRRGFPDMTIVLKSGRLMFVEMKRTKGGTVSKEQKIWIAALNLCPSVTAVVAKGFEEAVSAVEGAENACTRGLK